MPRVKKLHQEQTELVQSSLMPKEADESTESSGDDEGGNITEGQLYDYITNEPVADSPTERTLQAVARSLVEEYGFLHTQLRRDQSFSYTAQDEHGKQRVVRQRLSIVVYPENSRRDDPARALRICMVQPPATKSSDLKKGVRVLEDVLGALPHCEFGLWTNGTDLIFKHKIVGGIQPQYEDLYDLPGAGETAESLDLAGRRVGRIATGDNLQRTFARVHDYIYGNQGLNKDLAFWQVLNLIFCKIHDEQPGRRRSFWVSGTERNTEAGRKAIAKRIGDLFEEVRTHPDYRSIFTETDTITLNDRVLAYVVGELSRYNLLKTDVDVKGAAYEEITANMLKSQRGQFFTPTNVIRLMIEMIDPCSDADLTDPANWPRILDPACGSGRFLTYTLDYIRRKLANQFFPQEPELLRVRRLEADEHLVELLKQFASASLYGVDFDPSLKRVARMNMILNNDGHGNMRTFNSLEYPLTLGRKSKGELLAEYADVPIDQITDDAVRMWRDADLGTFDIVFTNPPFGAKIPIDDEPILRRFDLGHRWARDDEGRWYKTNQLQSRVAPEVLFVERCVQWVKEGTGRVAIVLPDGILGNPDAEYIRAWILEHCQVLASVDLPVETFLPQVGVQASLLFLRRKSRAERDAEKLGVVPDYPVFMAVAETVGHDRRGNPIYVRDADGAEIAPLIKKPVVSYRAGRDIVTEIEVREKMLDDDLPRIAAAYRAFLRDSSGYSA